MKAQNLRRLVEGMGLGGASVKLQECIDQKLVRPDDFSIRELAEAFLGPQWGSRFQPGNAGPRFQMNVMEAGDGVDVTAFSHIVGQIFFNKIADGWERTDRIGEKITTNFPTKLDGEKIPWVGHVRGLGEEVHPQMPYPRVSFGERYVTTPRCQKQGMILDLSKETIFFDHTGQMMTASTKIGENLAYNKEEMILSVVLGCFNTYSLNDNTANTYQKSTDSQTSPNKYTNYQTNTELTDWTSINNFYTLKSQILDPDSGLPIKTQGKHILCMPQKVMQARRIVGATETQSIYPGYGAPSPGSPGNVNLIGPNPIPDKFEVLTSDIAYQLLVVPPQGSSLAAMTAQQANALWLIGDLPASFYWMENWPMQIETAPVGNPMAFNQDIIMSYKVSFRGQCAVYEPRHIFKFGLI